MHDGNDPLPPAGGQGFPPGFQAPGPDFGRFAGQPPPQNAARVVPVAPAAAVFQFADGRCAVLDLVAVERMKDRIRAASKGKEGWDWLDEFRRCLADAHQLLVTEGEAYVLWQKTGDELGNFAPPPRSK